MVRSLHWKVVSNTRQWTLFITKVLQIYNCSNEISTSSVLSQELKSIQLHLILMKPTVSTVTVHLQLSTEVAKVANIYSLNFL